MKLNLKGKVVLISGSAKGIGRAIAKAFLEEDAKVVLTDYDEISLKSTLNDFVSKYGEDHVISFCGDMLNQVVIDKCVEFTRNNWGALNILVPNIGSGKSIPTIEAPRNEWEKMFNINLFSAIDLVRSFLPLLKKNNDSSILFISSITGMEATTAPLTYAAAKSSLISVNKNLSKELAKFNIRVNTIAPGNIYFTGGRWEEIIKEKPHIVKDVIEKEVPLKRFGTPEEIGHAAVFLCSEKSSFTTGSCFVIDGGQTH